MKDDWHTFYDKSSHAGCNPVELGKAATARIESDAKQIAYLEQENSVLHAKVRSLEIALSSEREACAKIAEDYGKARYAYETEGGKSKQDAFTAANSIAQLIRGRGET